jgi:hypothetical protein
MWGLQDIKTRTDLQIYCESVSVNVLTDRGGYAIYTDDEIIDLASVDTISSIKLILQLKKKLSGRVVSLDAREGTSYPIIKKMAGMGKLVIHHDELWWWGGELMHSLSIYICPDAS